MIGHIAACYDTFEVSENRQFLLQSLGIADCLVHFGKELLDIFLFDLFRYFLHSQRPEA